MVGKPAPQDLVIGGEPAPVDLVIKFSDLTNVGQPELKELGVAIPDLNIIGELEEEKFGEATASDDEAQEPDQSGAGVSQPHKELAALDCHGSVIAAVARGVELAENHRALALFNMAIDSKLRG